MELTITSANPLGHAAEIKQLFRAHERPEFPAFFERAYPAAVHAGATSWLGRDGDGRLVMHVACFPRRFKFGARAVVGGLLVNAIVAREYRTFVPALAMMRRAVEDAKALGTIDFLYTDPNQAAHVVFRAAGLSTVGSLRRYVLPVGHRRWVADGAIRLLHAWVRVARGGGAAAPLDGRAAGQFSAACFDVPLGESPRLRPYHDRALYASRLDGYPSGSDLWFTLHRGGPTAPPAAGLLVRGPEPSGIAALQAIRRDPAVAVASLIPGVVADLRRHGCTRLEIWALAESSFARELQRAGFVPRRECGPVVAVGLTPIGEAVVRAPHRWEITHVDCDR